MLKPEQMKEFKVPTGLERRPQLVLVANNKTAINRFELQQLQLKTNAERANKVLADILRMYDTGVSLSNQKAVTKNETP